MIGLEYDDLYLYTGDTETESGEVLQVEDLYVSEGKKVFFDMADGETWSSDELNDYEKKLVCETIRAKLDEMQAALKILED